jgi:CBS domain-containing protein
MGEQKVHREFSAERKSKFIKHLLDDVKALEYMLEHDLIEKDITRIGAEQEFCLVTSDWRPANNAQQILAEIDDPHFTTELARYNLEINLDPVTLDSDAFSKIEKQLKELLTKGSNISEKNNSHIVLTGILPTISKTHLSLDYITPYPRYYALNDMLINLRRSHFLLSLQGVDDLAIAHDSVLFEACNTSFQLHLQIAPADFISSFNWAQAISGPVLSICTNSPLLLGRELWSETRIALFKQSIDTRNISLALKDQQPRVAFGSDWAKGTVADIYKDNISKYKIILDAEIEQNSLDVLKHGGIPKLQALNLHSGTIYPWNRACYGVGNGKPHLRIENRYIPAGPSVIDEMANFAFWVGIMMGRPKKFDDMSSVMDFRHAKSNFIKAARNGREAIFDWDGHQYTSRDLITRELLPMAWRGLETAGIAKAEIERLLGVIEGRTYGKTASQWIVSNYRKLNKKMKKDAALRLITKTIHINQVAGTPVHLWKDANENDPLTEASHWVGHIMSTQLFSVKENDLAALATDIMVWKNIHHVPVEDEDGKLTGLLTWTHAQKFRKHDDNDTELVKEIMERNVITVDATLPIKEAIKIMKAKEIGCLPILQNDEMVGIITIHDVIAYDND